MESLNSFVLSDLQELDLDCEVFPAHKWATETGQILKVIYPYSKIQMPMLSLHLGM